MYTLVAARRFTITTNIARTYIFFDNPFQKLNVAITTSSPVWCRQGQGEALDLQEASDETIKEATIGVL